MSTPAGTTSTSARTSTSKASTAAWTCIRSSAARARASSRRTPPLCMYTLTTRRLEHRNTHTLSLFYYQTESNLQIITPMVPLSHIILSMIAVSSIINSPSSCRHYYCYSYLLVPTYLFATPMITTRSLNIELVNTHFFTFGQLYTYILCPRALLAHCIVIPIEGDN